MQAQKIIRLEQENGVTRQVDGASSLVCLVGCKDCNFTLQGRSMKLVIEGCANTTVTIDGPVLVGTMEVINSQGVHVHLNRQVPTIQIDNCSECSLHLPQRDNIRNVFVSKVTKFSVVEETSSRVHEPQFTEGDWETDQYVIRFETEGSLLLCDKVIREGAGYPTTQAEHDRAEAKAEFLKSALHKLVDSHLAARPPSSPSSSSSSAPSRPQARRPGQLISNGERKPVFPLPKPKQVASEEPEQQREQEQETLQASNVEPVEEEKQKEEANGEGSSSSLLNQIANFSINKLKPTKTTVRQQVAVLPEEGNRGHPNYGHSNKEDITEFLDDEETLQQKVKLLAQIFKRSKWPVIYTGAGVSTSAKIPDYRGPQGAWTRLAEGKAPIKGVELEAAQPTLCHNGIKKLVDDKRCKFVVSTNVDGLHRRSGLTTENLSELHGNAYLERCSKCKQEYMRPFDCTKQGQRLNHITGRQCDDCGGDLVDSIINFGEALPDEEFEKALHHSEKADLTIVMGSSMRVEPACSLPTKTLDIGGKLIIVNLQKTPYDDEAWLHIYADCDTVMHHLMRHLGYE
ncbi:NAD-dependent protein deacetylase sirtuin-7 [Balamuthia mandrillaris]